MTEEEIFRKELRDYMNMHSNKVEHRLPYDSYYEKSEYEGSYAHDVMRYDDDCISDAFEGDPDAYWNID